MARPLLPAIGDPGGDPGWATKINSAIGDVSDRADDAASAAAGIPAADPTIGAAIGNPVSATRVALDTLTTVGQGITPATAATFAAVQAALTTAAAAGTRATAGGTITTSSTLIIKSDCDLSELTINYTGSGVAVQVGAVGVNTLRKNMRLPKIFCTNKPAPGSGWLAGSVGVQFLNLYESYVNVPFVWKFETNMEVRGEGSGNVYNTYNIGSLVNGYTNLLLSANVNGWSNQNLYIGGRYSGDPAEGAPVTDSAQIRFVSDPPYSRPNNNTFLNPSIEGWMHDWMIDCDGGENLFINARFESTSGQRVRWGPRSYYNVIQGGHSASLITETYQAGAVSNMIQTTGRWEFMGSKSQPMIRIDNRNSSTQPAWAAWAAATFKDGTTNDVTGWRTAASALAIMAKTSAQTEAAVALLSLDGSLAFGDGTTAPTKKFRSFGSGVGIDTTHLSWVQHDVYDVGLTANRPRYVRASRGIVSGAFTTALRPTAVAAGVGAMIYDTTLSRPCWSDGTVWRAADGTTI